MKAKLILLAVCAFAPNLNASTLSEQAEALSQSKDYTALSELVTPLATGDYVLNATAPEAIERNAAIIYKGRAVGQIEGHGKAGGSNPEAIAFYAAHKCWKQAANSAFNFGGFSDAVNYQNKVIEQDPSLINRATLLGFRSAAGENVNAEATAMLSELSIDSTGDVCRLLFDAYKPTLSTPSDTLAFCTGIMIRIRANTPKKESLYSDAKLLKMSVQ